MKLTFGYDIIRFQSYFIALNISLACCRAVSVICAPVSIRAISSIFSLSFNCVDADFRLFADGFFFDQKMLVSQRRDLRLMRDAQNLLCFRQFF